MRHRAERSPWPACLLVAAIALLQAVMAPAAMAEPKPPLLQDDCGTGGDAGGTFATASAVAVPTSCSATLFNAVDDQDWYRFSVTAGQVISAGAGTTPPSFTGDFVDTGYCLYTPAGIEVGCDEYWPITAMATSTGEWRLKVFPAVVGYDYRLSVSASPPQDDCGTGSDAGASFASAAAIASHVADCVGSLDVPADTSDFYRFPVSAGDTVSARMKPNATYDFNICLYDPNGVQVGGCTFGGAGVTETISTTAAIGGSWRLEVRTSAPTWGEGPYWLSVSAAPPQNDCGTGADGGNTHGSASTITLPKTNCTGRLISGIDSDDYYRFSVVNGETIVVSMTPNAGANFGICLLNPSGTTVQCSDSGGSGATESITKVATVGGSWRLRVFVTSGTGNYTMSVSTAHNDCGIGDDAGDSLNTASPITLPKTNCAGVLAPDRDERDYYRFTVTAGHTIFVSMTSNASATYGVDLYAPDYSVIGSGLGPAAPPGSTHAFTAEAPTTGEYRLSIDRYFGEGTYTVSVSTQPPNDCGTGVDAGDEFETATPLSLPKYNCVARLERLTDSHDWYQFSATSSQWIDVSVAPNSYSDIILCLYDPNGTGVGCSYSRSNGTTAWVSHQAAVTGAWRILVMEDQFADDDYWMTAEVS